MSDATTLRTTVKDHFGGANSRKLITLTNFTEDNSVTTIDDDVLLSHCNFALGQFHMETGHTPDVTSNTHLYILVAVVVASLETAKGRESSQAMAAQRYAFLQMKSLREKSRGRSKSNSRLKPSLEPNNKLPDSDLLQDAYTLRKRVGSRNVIREVND